MEAKTNSTASIAAKVVRAEKSAPVFSSKQIQEDAKEFAKNLSQNYLAKHSSYIARGLAAAKFNVHTSKIMSSWNNVLTHPTTTEWKEQYGADM